MLHTKTIKNQNEESITDKTDNSPNKVSGVKTEGGAVVAGETVNKGGANIFGGTISTVNSSTSSNEKLLICIFAFLMVFVLIFLAIILLTLISNLNLNSQDIKNSTNTASATSIPIQITSSNNIPQPSTTTSSAFVPGNSITTTNTSAIITIGTTPVSTSTTLQTIMARIAQLEQQATPNKKVGLTRSNYGEIANDGQSRINFPGINAKVLKAEADFINPSSNTFTHMMVFEATTDKRYAFYFESNSTWRLDFIDLKTGNKKTLVSGSTGTFDSGANKKNKLQWYQDGAETFLLLNDNLLLGDTSTNSTVTLPEDITVRQIIIGSNYSTSSPPNKLTGFLNFSAWKR